MKLLLVDDHALFRAGMRYVLKELDPGITLYEANECKQAIDIVNEHSDLDLILLDLNMPGLAGFACINQVMLTAKNVPVVVLSADDRAETISHAVQQGVQGYIQKSDNAEDMLSSIKQILAGESSFPESYKNLPDTQEVNLVNRLTKRQREILALIVEGNGNKQIAARLGITEGTTRIHVTTIFKVLGVRSRSEAVYKALELGLAYQGQDIAQD
jgi:DNA-binding NarL/FixJ family response regulator